MMKRCISVAVLATALSMMAGLTKADDRCKECHPEVNQMHTTSLHGRAGKNCEACHGNVDAHLASNDKKDIITFGHGGDEKRQNGQCLSCHGGNQKLMFWENSKHFRENLACASCHAIHKGPKPTVKEPDKCFDCHKDVRSQANQYSRHPIVEGRIKCSDCHNPHGSLGHSSLRDENVNQLCYRCHADKRGPFVWEHAPVEEDCMKCHTPHGSKTIKLLTERQPRLCQNCHEGNQHPGTIYGANRSFQPQGAATSPITLPTDSKAGRGGLGRGCTGCHGHIHGSNSPATNGKTFIR